MHFASLRAIRAFTPVFDGLWRSNPELNASGPWIASSQVLLAMTHILAMHPAPELLLRLSVSSALLPDLRQMMPAVVTGIVTIKVLGHESKKQRKKEAERRQTRVTTAAPSPVQRPPCGRARLTAFHRGSRLRDVSPKSSGPGQASWDTVVAGVTRRFLSQSSECTSQTGLNAGRHDARTRPGAAVTSRRPRAPHPAPISRCRRRTALSVSGSVPYMATRETYVNINVTTIS